MYTYVLVCVRMCAYMHMCICYICVCMCQCRCMYVYMCTNMNVYACICVCVYVCVYACIRRRRYLYISYIVYICDILVLYKLSIIINPASWLQHANKEYYYQCSLYEAASVYRTPVRRMAWGRTVECVDNKTSTFMVDLQSANSGNSDVFDTELVRAKVVREVIAFAKLAQIE